MKKLIKRIIPNWIFSLYHLALAYAGAIFYRYPARAMIVIGVTGTNGKSTVVEILHRIFSDFGLRVASFSSLRFRIREKEIPNKLKMTMPGRFGLQRILSSAREAGCQVAIVEVTSEGIKQHRHRGVSFDAAVLTNLRPEHIESHGSFEAYREAKGRLFKKLSRLGGETKGRAIVNLDDPSAFYFLHFPSDKKYGFGLLTENARPGVEAVIPTDIAFTPEGFSFNWQGIKWGSSLVGDFNLYNVLASVATALAFKLPLESIRESIARTKKMPGRLEVIQEKPFRVVVDYAHTPDALEAVYRIVRSLWIGNSGRLIVVLGSAGGGRDRWKRPELGKIAERFADHIILTNEDPYDEDPEKIIEEIASKMKEKKPEVIIDRAEAIKKALAGAKRGDAVVITGKGAEQIMVVKGKHVFWDDRKIVQGALKKINGPKNSK